MPIQQLGDLAQEWITISARQGFGCTQDGGELLFCADFPSDQVAKLKDRTDIRLGRGDIGSDLKHLILSRNYV